GGVHDRLRTEAVDAGVGLRAVLPIDAGTVRHRLAPGKRRGEPICVVGSHRVKGGVRQAADGAIAVIFTASDDDDVMTLGGERTSEMPADESRSSGDGNFHTGPLLSVLVRFGGSCVFSRRCSATLSGSRRTWA